jgi:hypothetical protein
MEKYIFAVKMVTFMHYDKNCPTKRAGLPPLWAACAHPKQFPTP